MELLKSEQWASLNQQIHQLLKIDADCTVRVYRGVHHAAYEIALGTALFLSHKRSVGWLKGQSYGFQTVLPHLYKEGFQVQTLSQIQRTVSLSEWLASLKKDTSFVMSSQDNPISAEVFDYQELENILNEKKIFSISISHLHHLASKDYQVQPYSIRICDFGPDLAVAICGSRFKSPVQISSFLAWEPVANLSVLQEAIAKRRDEMKSIVEFETKIAPEFILPFTSLRNRSYLHTLISNLEVNGEAVVAEMQKKITAKEECKDQIVALNSCKQGFVNWDWWEDRPAAAVLRGLIYVPAAVIAEKSLIHSFKDALLACRI